MCCFYMPDYWVMSCLQWAAGETMCHLPPAGQPYSVRKKLADILNEAVARGESEAAAAASAASGGGGGGAPAGEL